MIEYNFFTPIEEYPLNEKNLILYELLRSIDKKSTKDLMALYRVLLSHQLEDSYDKRDVAAIMRSITLDVTDPMFSEA